MSTRPPGPPGDPDLPELSVLLGDEADDLIGQVVAELGMKLTSSRIMQVRYVPGRSVTVQYRVEGVADAGKTSETIVASAGLDVPDHVPVLAADGIEIAVWRFPHDPFLPGLAPASDPDRIRGVLEQLGVTNTERVRLRTRAYRPGRRAVIEVVAPAARIYLKVLRPAQVADLQRLHASMAESLPVPHSLGWSEDLGLVAIQAMKGRTLRKALESGTKRLPTAQELEALLDLIPIDSEASLAASPRRQAKRHAELLESVVPEHTARIQAIAAAVAGEANEPIMPVHGDFHTSQVLVKGPEIVGLIDVDTVGRGFRSDDYGQILGHVGTLATMSKARASFARYGAALISEFDALVDPVQLRLAIAASVFAFATGPFRVYERDWPVHTEHRIALADEWIASARDLGADHPQDPAS